MFTVKLGHILNAVGYFNGNKTAPNDTPFGRLAALQLPMGQAVKVVQLAKAIDAHVQDFQKAHDDLIAKYKGDAEAFPNDKLQEFNVELNEAAQNDVELPGERLRVEPLSQAPITTADLYTLGFLFEGLSDEVEKPKPNLSVVKSKRSNGRTATA